MLPFSIPNHSPKTVCFSNTPDTDNCMQHTFCHFNLVCSSHCRPNKAALSHAGGRCRGQHLKVGDIVSPMGIERMVQRHCWCSKMHRDESICARDSQVGCFWTQAKISDRNTPCENKSTNLNVVCGATKDL